MPDEHFKEEAIRCAEAAGYYPALGQREVDWDCVLSWAYQGATAGLCLAQQVRAVRLRLHYRRVKPGDSLRAASNSGRPRGRKSRAD